MGVRGLETSELVFEECRIPRENLLGKEGEGFKYTMISLDMGRNQSNPENDNLSLPSIVYALCPFSGI